MTKNKTSTNNQPSFNQTQFSVEEPIFENQAVYMDDKPPEDIKDLEQKAKNKKKLLIILGIVVFVFILILLLLVVIKGRKTQVEELPEEEIIKVTKELGPLHKRIEDARELLNLADPTKDDLSFPPIDMGIRLDSKKR